MANSWIIPLRFRFFGALATFKSVVSSFHLLWPLELSRMWHLLCRTLDRVQGRSTLRTEGLRVFQIWGYSDDQVERDRVRYIEAWITLIEPFKPKGYHLYTISPSGSTYDPLVPPTTVSRPKDPTSYPFARNLWKTDSEARFLFFKGQIWPGRDSQGREVIIKVVATLTEETAELRALKMVSSEPQRSDPRNHSIPVLEFVEIQGLIFAVMPRWGQTLCADYSQVHELLHYGRFLFQTLDFLHEQNIAHCDLIDQNTTVDLLLPGPPKGSCRWWAGVRGPDTRYSVIDFGASIIGPHGGYSLTGRASAEEMVEAKRKDMRIMASNMEIRLRCVQDDVPGLSELLDSMLDEKSSAMPTAAEASARYAEITGSLAPEVLGRRVKAVLYFEGSFQLRGNSPIYFSGW